MESPSVTPIPTANPESDIVLVASSGESNGKSDYIESCKNLPASSENMPEIVGHISKLEQMHEFAAVNIRDFSQPRELFTQPDEVNPTDISNNDTNLAKKHRDNGDNAPLVTPPSSPHYPPIDASDDP